MHGNSLKAIMFQMMDAVPVDMIESAMKEHNLIAILGAIVEHTKETLESRKELIRLLQLLHPEEDSDEKVIENITWIKDILTKHYAKPFPSAPIPEDPIILGYVKEYGVAATALAIAKAFEEMETNDPK